MNADDFSGLAAEAQAVESAAASDGAAEKPKRETESPTPTPSSAQLLTALLVPTFRVLAPAWEVTEPECALLGESYGAVLDKYFPDLDIGVEFAALLATLAVFGPRWGKPRAAVHHRATPG